jgi:hypothetical protein
MARREKKTICFSIGFFEQRSKLVNLQQPFGSLKFFAMTALRSLGVLAYSFSRKPCPDEKFERRNKKNIS